jgi:hypothetical protein
MLSCQNNVAFDACDCLVCSWMKHIEDGSTKLKTHKHKDIPRKTKEKGESKDDLFFDKLSKNIERDHDSVNFGLCPYICTEH